MKKLTKGQVLTAAAVTFGVLAALAPTSAAAGDAEAAVLDRGSWLLYGTGVSSQFYAALNKVPDLGNNGGIYGGAIIHDLRGDLAKHFSNNRTYDMVTYEEALKKGERSGKGVTLFTTMIAIPPASQPSIPYDVCIARTDDRTPVWAGAFNQAKNATDVFTVPIGSCEDWVINSAKKRNRELRAATMR